MDVPAELPIAYSIKTHLAKEITGASSGVWALGVHLQRRWDSASSFIHSGQPGRGQGLHQHKQPPRSLHAPQQRNLRSRCQPSCINLLSASAHLSAVLPQWQVCLILDRVYDRHRSLQGASSTHNW